MNHNQNIQVKGDCINLMNNLTESDLGSSCPLTLRPFTQQSPIKGQNLKYLLQYLQNFFDETSNIIKICWQKKDPELEPQFARDYREEFLSSLTREWNWLMETWEKLHEINISEILPIYLKLSELKERHTSFPLLEENENSKKPDWWGKQVEHLKSHVAIAYEQFEGVRVPKTCKIQLPCGHEDYFTSVEIGLNNKDKPMFIKHIKGSVLSEIRQIYFSVPRLFHEHVLSHYLTLGPHSVLVMPLMNLNLGQYVMYLNFKSELEKKAQEIVHQIIDGLLYLHKTNDPAVIHGNLKPTNILLDENFQIRLADFGINYKSTPSEISLIWKSVEQVRGYKNGEPFHVSLSSDVASAGMLMYFVLTAGQHPFGATIPEILENLVQASFELNLSDAVTRDLLTNMLMTDEVNRPDISEVTEHIFWWPVRKRCEFVKTLVEDQNCGAVNFLAKAAKNLVLKKDQAIIFARGGVKNTHRDISQFLRLMEKSTPLAEIQRKIPNLALHLYKILKPTRWAETPSMKPFFDARYF